MNSGENSVENEQILSLTELKPLKKEMAFLILFLDCILMFSYFIFINFSQGIENELLSAPYNFSNTEYGLFYGAISIPNLINPLFLGLYIDKNGLNLKIVLFLTFFILIGVFFVNLGVILISFIWMLLGNFFIGISIENISLIAKKVVLDIFNKKNNVIAIGALLFSGRIGLMASAIVIPWIYDITQDLSVVYLFAAFLSIITVLALFFIHILLNHKKTIQNDRHLDFKTLKDFFSSQNKILILLWFASFLVVASFLGFFSNANVFLTISMKISSMQASYFLLLALLVLAVFQIVFSYIMARIGYLIYFFIFGTGFISFSYALFIIFFQNNNEYLNLIPLLILAVFYAITSNFVYSFTPILVDAEKRGTALGILQCILNLSQLVGPFFCGIITDLTQEYYRGYFFNLIFNIILQVFIIIILLQVIRNEKKKIKGLTSKF